jgi:hypothetical protein
VNEGELIEHFPRLFHMAAAGSWPSIRAHGLLSTSALLDLFEVTGEDRIAVESRRRPDSVQLHHRLHGDAVIRDNKPLSDRKLAACLDDMEPSAFYCLLNTRVFFWLTEDRLETLLGARAYRDEDQTIITVDTARLLARQAEEVTLSAINSGSTVYAPQRRGSATFKRIEDYDFDGLRRRRGRSKAVAELAVDRSVPDIESVALRAELQHAGGTRELLWERA